MYCIVQEEDTKAISGIPMTWLYKNKENMWWPRTRNTSQLIKQKAAPQKDWLSFPCIVLKACIGKHFSIFITAINA